MHEIKIASDLSEIVLSAARDEKLTRVTGVNVTLGEMVQIVPDIFIATFKSAVADSIARDAMLNIEIVPVRMRCRKCGTEFAPLNFFSCDTCGSTVTDIISGNELFIKTIEGE